MNREVKLLPTEQSILNCSAQLRHFINGLGSFLLPRDTADLEFLLTTEVVEQRGEYGDRWGQWEGFFKVAFGILKSFKVYLS